MPVHTIPASHLHEDLLQIMREGETILHVVPSGRRRFTVVTGFEHPVEVRPADRYPELRAVSHAARVGAVRANPELNAFVTDDVIRPDGAA